ncbi:sulfatase-like hydrolase/transferase [Opitutaceae bacterium]|nr:sulfatase-like hydrolase/transferase [Opitutaceae bacterium]
MPFLTRLISTALLLLSIGTACADRPNLIIVLCDDLGYSDVGFNGATDIRTPELDALARGGVVFPAAYVAHPFCGPSRMSMMAGRYSHKFGGPFNLPNAGLDIEEYNRKGIPVSETLMSTTLQRAGYYTGAIGKWHMGIDPEFHPNARGFDDYYGFLGGGHRYFPAQYRPVYERQLKAGNLPINDYFLPLEHNGKEVNETEYITDALSREAARFVDDAATQERPFFLYLAYNAPHSPLEAREEDLALYSDIKDEKRRIYAAMVHAVDRGVGRVVDALKRNDVYENTLIVFLSDNGGKLSLGATNRPLSMGKGSVSEGGHRVPMFFHWPLGLKAGQIFPHPVTSLDFYPTFAALGEATVPATQELDGTDLSEALIDGSNPRAGRTLYTLRHRAGFSDASARRDQWKIRREGQSGWMLFNIAEDITESRNLRADHPELVREMVVEMQQWSQSHTEPEWFYTWEEGQQWQADNMPRFEETFSTR